MKTAGYEERVADALRDHGLTERALVSTMENASLTLLRARHPELRLGWSLPRMRRNPLANPITMLPAVAVLTYVRRALPRRRRQPHPPRRDRRADGALPARHPAPGRRGPRRRRRALRLDGRRCRRGSPSSSAAASPGVISNDPRLFGP